MNDDQCEAIVNAIKDLTYATTEVAGNMDNIYSYCDSDLRKEVHLLAEILEDLKIVIENRL